MATPPSVKRFSVDDFSGDWSKDMAGVVSRLNSFILDANGIFHGGVGVLSQLGGQEYTFQVATQSDVATATLGGGWSTFGTAPSYRVDAAGNVHLEGGATGGAGGSNILTGLPAPRVALTFAVDGNGAFGSVSLDTSGNLVQKVGTTNLALGGVCYRPAVPRPFAISPLPVQLQCTLPGGRAGYCVLGQVIDTTPGAAPVPLTNLGLQWHNQSGTISVDNIPGLLPNKVYSITMLALPVTNA